MRIARQLSELPDDAEVKVVGKLSRAEAFRFHRAAVITEPTLPWHSRLTGRHAVVLWIICIA
jgi:hypothetical protein